MCDDILTRVFERGSVIRISRWFSHRLIPRRLPLVLADLIRFSCTDASTSDRQQHEQEHTSALSICLHISFHSPQGSGCGFGALGTIPTSLWFAAWSLIPPEHRAFARTLAHGLFVARIAGLSLPCQIAYLGLRQPRYRASL